jgi:hypothetical protein
MLPECGCHVAGFSATPHTLVLFSPHFPLAHGRPTGRISFRVQRFPRGPSSAVRPVGLDLGSLNSVRPTTTPTGPICDFLDCDTAGVALDDVAVSDSKGTQIFDPTDSNMLPAPLDPLGANMLSNTSAKQRILKQGKCGRKISLD